MPLTIPVASEQVFGCDTTGPGRAAAAVRAACRAAAR